MAKAELQNPIFTNEDKAREYLENLRWPQGAFCPHCGSTDCTELKGKSTRPGLRQCNDCRKNFTVTVGTVYERSKLPLTKWLLATYLLSSSKKGISTHQLHRMLGVTYKSAWFMTMRIRESMIENNPAPIGGKDETVQADETYIGKKKERATHTTSGRPFIKSGGGAVHKNAVVSLVSKGKARTFHVDKANADTIRDILVTNVRRETALHTDESRLYTKVGREFSGHETVNHSAGEYVRRDGVTTNNVENYFSIFKRGMKGVYPRKTHRANNIA